MSSLSQFFNNNSTLTGGTVSFLGTTSSVTIPSDASYVAYGVIGAGSMGTHCRVDCCGGCGNGAGGGGFSWWDGAFSCSSPVTLCATVGATGATGGSSCVTGLTNIYATGGNANTGGAGSNGLINTCGGCGNNINCPSPPCCNGSYWCYRYYLTTGGGAGGLFANGGNGFCAGGGGFGSGGGAGMSNCLGGGWLGNPSSGSIAGAGVNGCPGNPGFSNQVTLAGKYSTAKSFLSASGGGAGQTTYCCGNIQGCYHYESAMSPAGAGGGGYASYCAGFGGGAGGYTGCLTTGTVLAGCGGGGNSGCICICSRDDPPYNCTYTFGCYCGGNGFVAIEYWK